MRLLRWIGSLWLLLLLFSSCEHKELCFNHLHRARIKFEIDWSRFGDRPTGMTLLFYPQDGASPIRYITHDVDGLFVDLQAGTYDVLVFNQTVDEFGSVKFQGMDRFMTAEVYASELVSKWYSSKAENERVIQDPELLGVGIQTDFVVTPEMVNEVEENPDVVHTFSMTPENKIYTTVVKLRMTGVQNARSVRASLEGMASGRMLGLDQPKEETGTHLLEGWSLQMDSLDQTKGCFIYTFSSFGLPQGHTGDKNDNLLNFSVLLKDNKTVVDFAFKVGHLIKQTAPNRLELLVDTAIEDPDDPDEPDDPDDPDTPTPDNPDEPDDPTPDIPDVPDTPNTSAGGFEAVVEEWGEEIEHEIEL